jgi:molybdopterin synthase catalytic subunit
MLELSEVAVVVGVCSVHRGEAFDACRFVIDQIKRRLPIWKKEHYASGEAEWVNCRHCAAPAAAASD